MKSASSTRTLPSARGQRIGIVAARFHADVVDRLIEGARSLLERAGAEAGDIQLERVAGAWEVPQGLDLLARRGEFRGLIALGTLIRGETLHFDLIAAECARGIGEVSRRHGVPVSFGVLTCETMEQALARSGGAVGNHGEDAAFAVLELIELADRLTGESAKPED